MRSDAVAHREKLIRAASRVFIARGIKAPLEAVLAEAGLGRGTLYRHFKSRIELAVAVLEIPLAELERLAMEHKDDSTLLRTFLGRHKEIVVIYQGCVMLAHEPEAAGYFQKLTKLSDKVYQTVIDRCKAHGSLSKNASIYHLRLATRMISLATASEASDADDSITSDAIDLICKGLHAIDQ